MDVGVPGYYRRKGYRRRDGGRGRRPERQAWNRFRPAHTRHNLVSAQAEFAQHVTLFDCASGFPQAFRLLGHCNVSIVLWSGFDSSGAHPCCMSRCDDGTVMVRSHC